MIANYKQIELITDEEWKLLKDNNQDEKNSKKEKKIYLKRIKRTKNVKIRKLEKIIIKFIKFLCYAILNKLFLTLFAKIIK